MIWVQNLDYGYDWNTTDILNGGKRGLITLQQTYDLKMQQLIEGSFLDNTNTRAVRKSDFLKPDDLASMSHIAVMNFKWLDNGLRYLRAAFDIFFKMTIHENHLLSATFEKTLKKMNKSYVSFHDQLLFSNKNYNIPYWKSVPYPVNPGKSKLGCGS